MSGLLLGIRMPSEDFRRLQLDDVNFDSKVDNLKTDISAKVNILKENIELVYCGNILDDDSTLTSSGLKPGAMVHVLKKRVIDIPAPPQPLSEQDIKNLVTAFRTLTFNPSHRNSLQKLSRPEILENIIMVTPSLSQDPVAMALLQDPELMVRLSNYDTIRKVVELHPALAEAAHHIAATVHEEALHNNTAGPSTSSGYSLLDFLSDDEDMESSQMLLRMLQRRIASRRRSSGDFSNSMLSSDENDDELESSQSSDSVQPNVSRQPSFSGGITSAQLAAAISSANQGVAGRPSNDSEEARTGITPEMVNDAMQRAMASAYARIGTPGAVPSTPTEEASTENTGNLQEQMRQMRELGLTDEAVNLQALQLSGGNVHAAVDLVFSGAIGSDTTA